MDLVLARGTHLARIATTSADLVAARSLRHRAFLLARGLGDARQEDGDAFDDSALQVLIEDHAGHLKGCYRLGLFDQGQIGRSYSAQFYDLEKLTQFPGKVLELGRFCLDPNCHDPDILRLAWAVMTRLVDQWGVTLLFGCSSFVGADPVRHAPALGALAHRIAPPHWRPGIHSPETVALTTGHDHPRAMTAVPPLLRTYLGMGGWVSDHAVIDRQMDTLHVFTGVEIAAIPAARTRALRAIAR